jgi:hypothetical protein
MFIYIDLQHMGYKNKFSTQKIRMQLKYLVRPETRIKNLRNKIRDS